VYRKLLNVLGHSPLFAWVGVRVFTPLDKWLYARTHGTITSSGAPVLPMCLLTTTGRKSGAARSTPLLYLRDGSDLVLVGSNWGQAHHPAWSGNLLANPRASVEIGQQHRTFNARLASEDERTRLWPRLLEVWPAYQTYARRSGRDLRVFVLSPVP
jgi:deazaflavin-dependent oxidoreductase (nitroreductase family)